MIVEGLEVLVVDDNGMNRKIFSMLLKKMGIHADEADSGARCLELTQQKKYDVIFMDHLMPEMDGIDTMKKVKAQETSLNASSYIIALTANDMNSGKDFYMEAGFDGYLEKPVLPQKLEELIKEL